MAFCEEKTEIKIGGYSFWGSYPMKKTAHGFTLIEAMVAMVILSVGLLALGRFQGTVTQVSAQSKARTEALRLAQAKMEQWRNFSTPSQWVLYSSGSDIITGTHTVFARSWVLVENLSPAYKTMKVTVNWSDRSGSQSVVLNSLSGKVDPMAAGQVLLALASAH